MRRLVRQNLSTAINPALANTNVNTSLWIYANARNWLHIGLDILKDHYAECLEKKRKPPSWPLPGPGGRMPGKWQQNGGGTILKHCKNQQYNRHRK